VWGGANGYGSVFAINTNGSGFTNLYSCTALDAATGTTNSDGANLDAGMILSGNKLYGVAQYGGPSGNGTVFAINANGSGFTNLHSFTAGDPTYNTNRDGIFPQGLLISGTTLYGMARYGGSNDSGTVFALSVPISLPVALFAASPANGLAPLTVAFINQSTGVTNYAWAFGDGNVSTLANPTNTYTNAGTYSVTLTAIGPGGTNKLTKTNYIVAVLASAVGNQTICCGSATVGLGGSVGGGATGGIWSSSGTGTFSPNATTLNATYQPSAADCTAGTVTLTLTTTGGTGAGTANVVVTIRAVATAAVGGSQTICSSGSTTNLAGSVGGSATGGFWSSSGTGTFLPNATALNATYTPSTADASNGIVTLTLATTGQSSPCAAATAQVVVTIRAAATVAVGGNQPVCSNGATTGLGGTLGGGATGGLWSSSGTGTFSPNATTLNATYTPSTADVSNGSVTLTLWATGQPSPCGAATAQVVVTIRAAATVNVGPAQTICSSGSTTNLAGSVGGGCDGGFWNSPGAGTFSPNAAALNATYTPSAADVSNGSVTLTLWATGQQSPCGAATAQVVVTVRKAATVAVGVNQTICSSGVTAGLGGTVGGGATGGTWSTTTGGTFTPNATTLNATYAPSMTDAANGSVTLTLSSTGQQSPCGAATAQVVVAVRKAATASAVTNQTICAGSSTAGLGGTVGGGATGGTWGSSGTGTFSPGATTLNASYTPSASDIVAGTVTLTLSSTGQLSPCGPATAQVVLTVQSAALGTTALLEGPGPGSDSVVLAVPAPTTAWNATVNAAWLHLSPANQSGAGSTNVIFSYDANPGATRSGTLTVACQTLTVTQAAASYVAAPGPLTTLVSAGLDTPTDVAVDGTGNVYIADYGNSAIKEWTVANNSVTTLVAAGLSSPLGVAVDGAGNVYISDYDNNAIKEWTATNNTVITLVASGLNQPGGVAVDAAGNVYIADTGNSAIKKWTVANNTLAPLISAGLSQPGGIAVDAAGNVYIADTGTSTIKKWTAANNTLAPLVAAGLSSPWGVAVDGAGNVYVADMGLNAILEWAVTNSTLTSLVAAGLNSPAGVAVDGAGNLYIADTSNGVIEELPRAFVDPTPKGETASAGGDVLPVVLPPAVNLRAPFAPTSDQAWLTITGITNGVVGFAFTANTGSTPRTGHITLLGQPIAITQAALMTPPILFGPKLLGNGSFQFAFSNNASGASFTVLTTTNLSLPLTNWTVAGPATNIAPGLFQFSTPATNNPRGYYRVRSP